MTTDYEHIEDQGQFLKKRMGTQAQELRTELTQLAATINERIGDLEMKVSGLVDKLHATESRVDDKIRSEIYYVQSDLDSLKSDVRNLERG